MVFSLKNVSFKLLSSLLVLSLLSTSVFAAKQLPEVEVIGEGETAFESIPGSGVVLNEQYLKETQPLSAAEALRQVSGLSIRDEDGYGRRLNISTRGLNGDRSRKVLVLEDGVPLSIAPYGENALYYAPVIERMERIEVLKGSGSILYGPQTVGGVVNFITKRPFEEPGIGYGVTYGDRNYTAIQSRAGGTWDNVASDVSFVFKGGEGPRAKSPFAIYDTSARVYAALDERNDIGIKVHYFNEDTTASYRGLTTDLYENGILENPAIHDVFYVERVGTTLTHEFRGDDGFKANTALYAYFTRRDWWRQDFDLVRDGGKTYERISGNGNDNESIFWENSNGGRNREYRVVGIEPRFEFGNWKTGLKAHYEIEDNRRINGDSFDARSGLVRSYEQRSTLAFAGYGQYTHTDGNLSVIPGVRVETFQQDQQIFRQNNATVDLHDSTGFVTELIPGLGVTYQVADNATVFAGAHRGFAPPRFSDAIKDGVDQKLDAERSVNYEFGVRSNPLPWLTTNATAFLIDYDNQVIAASESGGITEANSGRSISKGFEFEIGVVNDEIIPDSELFTNLNLTFTDARFLEGEYDGNQIPYVARELYQWMIGVRHNSGFSLVADAHFMGDRFSDEANTETAAPNGEIGRIGSNTVWNLTASYQPDEVSTYFASVKNLFNERYIESRNPEGIFAGNEINFQFGYRHNI